MANILKDRLIVITGTGRSGTSILGKVLGSMQPSVYCFEPHIMKYLSSFSIGLPDRLLFESFFLQEIHGRGNMNQRDHSCSLNYMSCGEIISNRKNLRRREDAIKYLNDNKHLFIVKNTELQPQMELISVLFPGVRFIHIVRNGYRVVNSAIARGWYTDEFCNSDIIEDMVPHYKCNIPRYVDQDCWDLWSEWNPETRAACAWRCSVNAGIEYREFNPVKCIQIKYETLVNTPYVFACGFFNDLFGLKPSELTLKHCKDIKRFKGGLKMDPSYIDKIQEPERTKFFDLNNRLDYEY